MTWLNFYLSLSSFMWSTLNSLRRSLRIFLFFSLSVCLLVPVWVCWTAAGQMWWCVTQFVVIVFMFFWTETEFSPCIQWKSGWTKSSSSLHHHLLSSWPLLLLFLLSLPDGKNLTLVISHYYFDQWHSEFSINIGDMFSGWRPKR